MKIINLYLKKFKKSKNLLKTKLMKTMKNILIGRIKLVVIVDL
nr:MAG TPA: hypothetical protein [Bacteriophage sp.]